MSYMVDKSPAEDKLIHSGVRPWEPKEHKPVLTASRSAYKPYSTYVDSFVVESLAQPLTLNRVKNKYTPWQPKCAPR
jgi:NADH:ubiquinone oxidoreductase subunit